MAVMSLHLVHREVRPWGDKYLVIFGVVDGVMWWYDVDVVTLLLWCLRVDVVVLWCLLMQRSNV